MEGTSTWTHAGRALVATLRAVLRLQFWRSRLLELMRLDLFLLAMATAGLIAFAIRTGGMQGLVIGTTGFSLVSWLSAPILAHAWCPPMMRESAAAMGVEVEPHEPSLGTFYWWWLRLFLVLLPLLVAGWFIVSRHQLLVVPAYLAVLALAGWLGAGFAIRCCLAGAVPPASVEPLLQAVPFTRRLLWLVLCFVVGLGLEWVAYKLIWLVVTPELGSGPDLLSVLQSALVTVAVLGIVAGTMIAVIVLAVWAALVVQCIAPQEQESPGSTLVMGRDDDVPTPHAARPARAIPWGLIALLLVGAAIAAAWWGRLTLLDFYIRFRHPQAYVGVTPAYDSHHALQQARLNFACAGRTAEMKLLARFGVRHDLVPLELALGCAAGKGHKDTVLYLLQIGADVNDISPLISGRPPLRPQTPLQEAAAGAHGEMVTLLLQRGADVGKATSGGTALHYAARSGDLGVVKRLVAAGARGDAAAPELPVVGWATAHQRAVPSGQRLWRQHLAGAEAAGLAVAARDAQGRTLLHWAAGQGELELVQVLLERGLSPADEDARGALPLTYLVKGFEIRTPQETIESRTVVLALAEGQQQLGRPVRMVRPNGTDAEMGWPSFPPDWAIRPARLGQRWLQDLLGPRLEAPGTAMPPAAPGPAITPASTLR